MAAVARVAGGLAQTSVAIDVASPTELLRLGAEVGALRAEVDSLRAQLDTERQTMARINRSLTFRLASPLHALANRLRGRRL